MRPILAWFSMRTREGIIRTYAAGLTPTNSMKNMYFALMVGAACCVGCRTSQNLKSQRFQSVVDEVLAEHHFAPPSLVRGTNGILWAVAARPHSESAVEVAEVEIRLDGGAAIHIVSYQYGPSAWAILGRLFTHDELNQEALLMQSTIADRLTRHR